MPNPNIVNTTTILGNFSYAINLGTTTYGNMLLSTPANRVIKINSIFISNIDTVNAADVSVFIQDGDTGPIYIARTISVPADSTLVVMDKSTSLYLTEFKQLYAFASASGDLTAVVSYEEIG